MQKQELFSYIDAKKDYLLDLAWQIFDKPEADGQEYFAAGLLSNALKDQGFEVEMGVGGLETAFRATWSNAGGGVNIGILGEYDALVQKGHACGHHMQTPAAIGAVMAVKAAVEGTDIPCTLTVYGTPAEETFGGKIVMIENGAFRELDVALSTHAATKTAFVAGSSMALISFDVHYHGVSAHASARAYEGKSAGDAMLLSFNAVEFMREHVKDGTRMHYTIKEALAPANVVPPTAWGRYTLRSGDNSYLPELERRFRNIVQGACLMTDTTATIEKRPTFEARQVNQVLRAVAMENLKALEGLPVDEELHNSGGSTDFGNVTRIVPSVMFDLPYCDAPGHSDEWVAAGKTQQAVDCTLHSAKALAGVMYDLVTQPELAKKAREEFLGKHGQT